jgi:hypothetical protein
VWAVLEGAGVLRFCATGASGELSVEHPGVYELVDHRRHTAGELQLQLRGGVRCHAVCFTPGVA